jgi:hypothetical protein
MKTNRILLGVIAVTLLITAGTVMAAKTKCTTIQDGILLTSAGDVITTGYDKWGYNYQAHMFNGGYCDVYRDAAWCQPYKDDNLIMKWNDAWLSNKDCDGDGLLDRHYGYPSYIGSGAWETNHQSGTYINENGETCYWNYFVKIVAKPTAGTVCNAIWGDFCVIQEVYNDPCVGFNGLLSKELPPGFGAWK